jgi:hypothetical protein
MLDGRFVTISWQDVNKAFKKVKEEAYVISFITEKLLRDLFDKVMVDVVTLEMNIEASRSAYHQQIEAAQTAREARRLAHHVTIAGTPPDDALEKSENNKLETVAEVEDAEVAKFKFDLVEGIVASLIGEIILDIVEDCVAMVNASTSVFQTEVVEQILLDMVAEVVASIERIPEQPVEGVVTPGKEVTSVVEGVVAIGEGAGATFDGVTKDNEPIVTVPLQVETKKHKKLSLRKKVKMMDVLTTQDEPTMTPRLGLLDTASQLQGEETEGEEEMPHILDKDNDAQQIMEKQRLELVSFLNTQIPEPLGEQEKDVKRKKRKSHKVYAHKPKKLLSGIPIVGEGEEKATQRKSKQIFNNTKKQKLSKGGKSGASNQGGALKYPNPPNGDPWAGFNTTSSETEQWPSEIVVDGEQDDRTAQGMTKEEQDAWDNWNEDEWCWDHELGHWVFTGPSWIKRVRRKDLSNKMEKNWRLGMRRNWNTPKKQKMLDKITITRDNMHLVIPSISPPKDK